jgi:hypothetical protein
MSDPWLMFHPVMPAALSSGLLLMLALIIVWLEWKRPISFLTLRLLATVLVIASVAGLILRPLYKTEKSNVTVLLTKDYSPFHVDSLQKHYPGLTLLLAPGAKDYKNSLPLTSWHELTNHQNLDIIAGLGLPQAAQELVSPGSFHFLPAALPSGIIQLRISDPVFPDRRNSIEGVIHAMDVNTKVYLDGPGGPEDSVLIESTGKKNFKLVFTPKEPGNFIYTLRSNKGFEEKLPIQVSEHQGLDVLFIQNYPTFESRYLKNFLGKRHRLLFRYQLSRNIYRYEYLNRKEQPLSRLNTDVLSLFDLLVIDSDALLSLSKTESRELQKAVHAGLGMILLFNEDPARMKKLRDFLPVTFHKTLSDTARFILAPSQSVTLPAWPVAPAVSTDPIVSIVRNKNRTLSGYLAVGFGKTGFHLLQETYRLVLQGDSVAYNTFWSGLIEQTSRSSKNNFSIKLTTPWPWFPNEPIATEIISSGPEPELHQNGSRIPLIESPLIDNVWEGKIWEDQPGWHSLMIRNDSTRFYYFIAEKNSWASLASANMIRETSLRASSSPFEKTSKDVYEPVPLWVFYILFLMGGGVLWLTPKLSWD